MPARWDVERENQLRVLVKSGRYTYGEIASLMGLNKNQIATKANYLGLSNPTYLKRITKHAHLREPAMKYFLTHTAKDTREHFGLTESEFKSLMTVGYRDESLAHLRKDKRRHDAWTTEELLFLARYAGVQPRDWIARKLERGTTESIKETLYRLSSGSRHMNGIPRSWVRDLLPGVELGPLWSFRSAAGAPGPKGDNHPVLVPWVELARAIRWKRIDPTVKACIVAMAKFQLWIHQLKSPGALKRRLKKGACNG